MKEKKTAIEFFAGSGLVTEGLKSRFDVIWANDISEKKKGHYICNHGSNEFRLADIRSIHGEDLPTADLVWSSFPCQDLSLAGRLAGIDGKRSGLFWEWLRILDEIRDKPKVVCLENVVGLISSNNGKGYQSIHCELAARGYRVGPLMIDAIEWVPQSRKRIFIVAIDDRRNSSRLEAPFPKWPHPPSLIRVSKTLKNLVWWNLPLPPGGRPELSDAIDWTIPVQSKEKTELLMALIPPRHRKIMDQVAAIHPRWVFPGYRRTRSGKQCLELRFDNVSGCLRTAEGGSSRQFLILWNNGQWSSRLLASREAARLMGAPDSYKLSNSYNDAYSAMGDAVVVPVVRYLSENLLSPLAETENTECHDRTEAERFCLVP